MRILNQDSDKSIQEILLLLTKSEASELRDELERLLSSNQSDNHGHINDTEYQKEITVAIYDDSNLNGFDDRSKRLIIEDK